VLDLLTPEGWKAELTHDGGNYRKFEFTTLNIVRFTFLQRILVVVTTRHLVNTAITCTTELSIRLLASSDRVVTFRWHNTGR